MTLPGHEFLTKLDTTEGEIRALSEKITTIRDALPEENREELSSQIDTAVGSGALLLKGKCKQFRDLCQKNIAEGSTNDSVDGEGNFRTTKEDLEGFWDMIQLPIQKVKDNFAAIERLKENGWTETTAVLKKKEKSGSNLLKKKPLTSKNDEPSNNDNKKDEEEKKKKLEARRRFRDFRANLQQSQTKKDELIIS